jgi:ATP/maltotriose-dependent transcriptional regulator MalT
MAHLATSNLGRAAARAGRTEDGRSLLLEALAGFDEIKAGSFVLETKARLAECAILAGDAGAALKQADETLAAIRDTGAVPVLRTMLHRLRGYALMQSGDLEGAEEAIETSLEIARAADAVYELAQSLEARARLHARRGIDGAADEEEARTLLSRLGVISQPKIPLSE